MIVLRFDPSDKYSAELLIDGRPVLTGRSGLEEVSFEPRGRRTFIRLLLAPSAVTVAYRNGRCPESERFNEVLDRLGDRGRISQLEPECSMLRQSPTACVGCPFVPVSHIPGNLRHHSSSAPEAGAKRRRKRHGRQNHQTGNRG